jgi:hypothetical protein
MLVLFVLYNKYSGYYEEELMDNYISKNVGILNENIDFEKQYASYLSLFLSKDNEIKKALLENNQSKALEELKLFLGEVKDATGSNDVDVQIHTYDTKAFARSWDTSDYYGTDLSSFRKGLLRVKKTGKPIVSIELGKRLNIKAITPIFDQNGTFAGSVEAIVGFQNMKKRLHRLDLDIIGLLDQKFIDIAVDLRKHKKIGRYYLVEKAYSKSLYNILQANSGIFTDGKYYHKIQNRIIVLVPMKSVGIQDVGIIALSMPANMSRISGYRPKDAEAENSQYVFRKNNRKVIIK